MDASRIVPGSDMTEYWEGFPIKGGDHYGDERPGNPQSAGPCAASVPDARSLYPGHAGSNVHFTAIVCHPTSRTNTDPNYVLPGTGGVIPHMLPPGQSPRLLFQSEYLATLGG